MPVKVGPVLPATGQVNPLLFSQYLPALLEARTAVGSGYFQYARPHATLILYGLSNAGTVIFRLIPEYPVLPGLQGKGNVGICVTEVPGVFCAVGVKASAY